MQNWLERLLFTNMFAIRAVARKPLEAVAASRHGDTAPTRVIFQSHVGAAGFPAGETSPMLDCKHVCS